ncbi:hypothetical protein CKO42_07225 [Lamprobacter modestohalophilus]|uniref:Uncharacterized protein n=1 Tax=Lamprobacter modestohalophilus TaxID=1064514 RepID=A0A9X0W7I0_9GAMM|nr:hypothetical protein [Lamprobacter modestohalophilus]
MATVASSMTINRCGAAIRNLAGATLANDGAVVAPLAVKGNDLMLGQGRPGVLSAMVSPVLSAVDDCLIAIASSLVV